MSSSSPFRARLDQRLQITLPVENQAAIYPNLASAVWAFQVIGDPDDAPVLDCRSSGAGQANSACLVTYISVAGSIVVQAPSSAVQLIDPGVYSCGWSFLLPGTDWEDVGYNAIEFWPGNAYGIGYQPGSPGSGSADTVMGGKYLMPNPVPPNLSNAITICTVSAANAAASAASAAASASASASAGTLTDGMAAWFATLPTSNPGGSPLAPWNNGGLIFFGPA